MLRYHPIVVGITGSVGKTSTKEAVVAALGMKYRVRGTSKNYNTEIGVPLTIIGAESGGASVRDWIPVIIRGLMQIVKGNSEYPEALVLEMGADHPGDIGYLVKLAPPRIGIITAISPTHTEFFGSVAGVAREKAKLIAALPPDGLAILNSDAVDLAISKKTAAKVITYGFGEQAEIRGSDLAVQTKVGERLPAGMRFKVTMNGNVIPMLLPGVLGGQHPTAALAAVVVAEALNLNLVQIAEGLRLYRPAPSRMRVLPGIKDTVIIDDTYNASPAAMEQAIEATAVLPIEEGAERIVVLGDMLELGALAEEEHAKIGRLVAARRFDLLVTVGELGKVIAHAARKAGMAEHRVATFSDSDAARVFIQEKLEVGDVVLVKGSKRMKMIKVVKEIMAEPERAEELLANYE